MLGSNTLTLQCNIILSPSQQLLGINLERKRWEDHDFSVVVLFPSASGTNTTYVDTSLATRAVTEKQTNGVSTIVSLIFTDTQCNDTAQYKWVISYLWNVYYTVERISNVSVNVRGTFSGSSDYGISVSHGIDVKEGTTITVKCKADIGNNPKGVLAMYYFLDGSLHHFHPYVLTTGHPTPTRTCSFAQEAEIYLPMTRKWNGMWFRCVLQQNNKTEFGDDYRQSNPINVTYPPSNVVITLTPDHNPSHVYIEGETITLNCTSDANPPPSYTWQLSNASTATGPVFVVKTLRRSDSGMYICKVKNGVPDAYHVVQAYTAIRIEVPPIMWTTDTSTAVATSSFTKRVSKFVTPSIFTKSTAKSIKTSTKSPVTGTPTTANPVIIGR